MEFATAKVTCPGCGATIEFKTTDSIVAVCQYCHSVAAKSEIDIENYGIKSNIVNDFSKIQIGTSGVYKSKAFTVLGRVQVKYVYGSWNEWYILFSDGTTGWLSDILDEYIVTVEYSEKNQIFLKENLDLSYEDLNFNNSFDSMEVDLNYVIGKVNYLSIDVTAAEILGAEGEIAFNIYQNKQMRVVDLKRKNLHVTIDYSEDINNPIFYFGEILSEKELFLSNIRTIDQINESTGQYKGKLTSFECPSCGTSNPKIDGQTSKAFCVNCHSELGVHDNVVEILKPRDENRKISETTLKCGNIGTLNDKKYIVIGVILKNEVGENAEWVEYFLYEKNSGGNLIWLVEDRNNKNNWSISEKLQEYPIYKERNNLIYKGLEYKPKYPNPYYGNVLAVWGSFNWEVNLNDVVGVNDYETTKDKIKYTISKEFYDNNSIVNLHKEVTFTNSRHLELKKVLESFNISKDKIVSNPNASGDSTLESELNIKSFYVIIGILLLVFFVLCGGLDSGEDDVMIGLFILAILCYLFKKGEDLIVNLFFGGEGLDD